MKQEQWNEAMHQMKDEWIEEAGEVLTEPESKKRRKGILLNRWAAAAAAVCLIVSLAGNVLAFSYIREETNPSDIYMRDLSEYEMNLEEVPKFEARKFLDALLSDDPRTVYIAINRLVECYNDYEMKGKAREAIRPFMKSEEPKIAEAAALAVDILSDSFQSEWVYHMSDGSYVFPLFVNYSGYGSGRTLWRIADGELLEYRTFDDPMKYICDIWQSPDATKLAVTFCSNKSSFLVVIHCAEGIFSPELVGSAIANAQAGLGITILQRSDYENYSGVSDVVWVDDNTLKYTVRDGMNELKISAVYYFEERELEIESAEALY